MAILDFLWGGKAKRARARRLLDVLGEPCDRLRHLIHEAGIAQAGEEFEAIRTRFVDCRIYRTAELANLPRDERHALDRLVISQMGAAGPIHLAIRAAMNMVVRDWHHGGLVEAAARGCLRALDALNEHAAARSDQGRLMRTMAFLDVDVACGDVRGELEHIAGAPSLFW